MIKFEENHIATQKEIDRAKRFYSFWYIPSIFFCWIGVLIIIYGGWDVYARLVAFIAKQSSSPVDAVVALFLFIGPAAAAIVASGYVTGWFGKRVFAPRKLLKKLSSEDIDSVLRLADTYPSLEEYRAKVAETRRFVVGDVHFMERRAEVLSAKKRATAIRALEEEKETALMKVNSVKTDALHGTKVIQGK